MIFLSNYVLILFKKLKINILFKISLHKNWEE